MAWKMYDAIVEGTLKIKTKTIDVVNDLLIFNGNTIALLSDSRSAIATYSSDKIEIMIDDSFGTAETVTNKSWFGKRVYRKVVSTGALTGSANNDILMFEHNVVGIEDVVSVDFSAKIAGSPIWMTSSYSYIMEDPAGEYQQIRVYVDGLNLAIRTSADLDKCFLIFEYTKV